MRLILKACFACIGSDGNLKVRDLQDRDLPYLAEVLNGTEIDGVKFDVIWQGNSLEIAMEGDGLSQEIKPNYIERLFFPVSQITFKDPEARSTANVLNKFLRRANRVLGQEPCNKGKPLPPNMILVRDAEIIC